MVVRIEDARTEPGQRSGSRPQLPRQAAAAGAASSQRFSLSAGRRSATVPARRSAGARLASARDRQRLRERYAQEHERVEKMLASAPEPIEPLSGSARSSDVSGHQSPLAPVWMS